MNDAQRILEAARNAQGDFLHLLKRAVELESPTYGNKPASDACGKFFQDLYASLGFSVSVIPQTDCGDQFIAEYGEGGEYLFLAGHYDTVFPVGTLQTMPWRLDGEKACGPGVLDMKGGFIQCYLAVRILRELALPAGKKLRIFFNSDEEAGSPSSHARIMQEARAGRYSIILEPGLKNIGDTKNSRSGGCVYTISAFGRSAHASLEPQNAISPIAELANMAGVLAALNNFDLRTTVTPTFLSAGLDATASVVPANGQMIVHVRYTSKEEMDRVTAAITGYRPTVPGMRLEVVRGREIKPVEFSGQNLALFARADALAHELGFALVNNAVGGSSDGNFTVEAGAATIDSMGLTGEFLHNEKEYVLLEHIPYRVALLARMLQTL